MLEYSFLAKKYLKPSESSSTYTRGLVNLLGSSPSSPSPPSPLSSNTVYTGVVPSNRVTGNDPDIQNPSYSFLLLLSAVLNVSEARGHLPSLKVSQEEQAGSAASPSEYPLKEE